MNMNKALVLPLAVFLALAVIPAGASAAISVTVSQSGADTDEVMKGRTFVVEASGWSGDCSQATISFSGCSSCSLSGENTQKTIGGGATSVTWTTTSASQKASAQTISVSVSSGCTLQQADSTSFDIALPPSLSIEATKDVSSVNAGSTFTANINIVNSGETAAQDISIDVSGTGMSVTSGCSSLSSIDEGQSAAQTCTVKASSAGIKTVTFTASSTNADSASDSFSMTVNSLGDDGDDTDGGDGVTGGDGAVGVAPAGQTVTKTAELSAGESLKDNADLQDAVGRALGIGALGNKTKDDMMNVSAEITSDISATREFSAASGKSTITTKLKYNGDREIKNLIIFESVPKTFSSSASLVSVSAPGGTVEIAEEDPSWVILYPEVSPGDEMTITYEVTGTKSSSVLDDMNSEVYAEELTAVAAPSGLCTAGQERCLGNELERCSPDGTSWVKIERCEHGCDPVTVACKAAPAAIPAPSPMDVTNIMVIVAAVIVVLIVILTVFYLRHR